MSKDTAKDEFQFIKNTAGKPVKMLVKEQGAVADELVFEKQIY